MTSKISLGAEDSTEEKANVKNIFSTEGKKVFVEVKDFDKERHAAEMEKIRFVAETAQSITDRALSAIERISSKDQEFLLAVLEKSPECFSKALDFKQSMAVATVNGMFVEPTRLIMEKIEKIDLMRIAEISAKGSK